MIILVAAMNEIDYESFISLIYKNSYIEFKYLNSPERAEGWYARLVKEKDIGIILLRRHSLHPQWPAIKEGLKRSGFNI
jgi:hypothetical protein